MTFDCLPHQVDGVRSDQTRFYCTFAPKGRLLVPSVQGHDYYMLLVPLLLLLICLSLYFDVLARLRLRLATLFSGAEVANQRVAAFRWGIEARTWHELQAKQLLHDLQDRHRSWARGVLLRAAKQRLLQLRPRPASEGIDAHLDTIEIVEQPVISQAPITATHAPPPPPPPPPLRSRGARRSASCDTGLPSFPCAYSAGMFTPSVHTDMLSQSSPSSDARPFASGRPTPGGATPGSTTPSRHLRQHSVDSSSSSEFKLDVAAYRLMSRNDARQAAMGLGAKGSHSPAEEATAGRVVNEDNPLRRVRWEASRPAAGGATELV